MKSSKLALVLLMSAIVTGNVQAQTEYNNTNVIHVNTNAIALGGPGAVLGDFPIDPSIGGLPVGLEHDGGGNLLGTAISVDTFYTINTSGTLVNGPVSIGANSFNPIGITITADGTSIYVTDSSDADVDMYDTAGNYASSFSVAAETTFPEGITYSQPDGNLYVVGGSGVAEVLQYDLAGTLLNRFPINGSSPDGIALDLQRCVFWIYDSGTDTVRSYDSTFTQIDAFPGTGAAGFSSGEGLAVIGNSLYVMASGSDTVVEFDISTATTASGTFCQSAFSSVPIPATNKTSLFLLTLLLLIGGGIYSRKFS